MSGAHSQVDGAATPTSGARASGLESARNQDAKIARAWERFAAGEDDVRGVRPEILLSWYRCREQYRVNPELDFAPTTSSSLHNAHSLDHDVVFAELGGLARLVYPEIDLVDGLVTVADGSGRILASWGDPRTLEYAAESNLSEFATWSESGSGTNGMGTALVERGAVLVEGPEHWCSGFHGWTCAGVSIRDVVTDEPLAVLNISRWGAHFPRKALEWLDRAARTTEAKLRERASRKGEELAGAFSEARLRNRAPLAAVDTSGKVVITNEEAAGLLGVLASAPATDPLHRCEVRIPNLASLVQRAIGLAQKDHDWVGSAQIQAPFINDSVIVTFYPVFSGGDVIGMLAALDESGGELFQLPTTGLPDHPPARMVGVRGDNLVLLAPSDIRFVEAKGDTVWLVSDQGAVQAHTHGLENVERQLRGEGFVRVHRSYLVNVHRIREVKQAFKGALWLVTDSEVDKPVPVSRRRAPELRRLLGIQPDIGDRRSG